MSFAIKHGLFKLKITDRHAILGVPLDADGKQIRLRYLKIAQQLHPDTCKSDEAKKELASQILSKLVNPAYEELSRKNSSAEHQLVLTQIGKHLAEKKDNINLDFESARELMKAGDKVELLYLKQINNLAKEQYKSLEEITNTIAQISELNLVYLMLKYNRGLNREDNQISKTTTAQTKTVPPKPPAKSPQRSSPPQAKTATPKPPPPPTPAPRKIKDEPTPQSRIDSYIRRAQQYIDKKEFDRAIKELRDALKIDPNYCTSHALLGKAYLLKQQLTMAKVHINRAYQANPNDPIAIESKKQLDKLTAKQNKSKSSSSDHNKKAHSKSRNSGGFFSGIFGVRKK